MQALIRGIFQSICTLLDARHKTQDFAFSEHGLATRGCPRRPSGVARGVGTLKFPYVNGFTLARIVCGIIFRIMIGSSEGGS